MTPLAKLLSALIALTVFPAVGGLAQSLNPKILVLAAPKDPMKDAVLMREDRKIGYRVVGIESILKIEEALVLDEKVGPPNPGKNFK